VQIKEVELEDYVSIQCLLQHYMDALEQTYQYEMVEHIRAISTMEVVQNRFVKVVPE
jgi:hypothetical protein